MKIFLILYFLSIYIFAESFEALKNKNIENINKIIKIYKNRANCIKNGNLTNECIKRYPIDEKSDNLAILISSSFPKIYYLNILNRDLKILEKEKFCWGRSLKKEDVNRCLKSERF